ncbi:MAG: VWA domain-containing protein [Myxococcales bacterium]|nr:VWA domain-containing protein [Myxococcales bacterium]
MERLGAVVALVVLAVGAGCGSSMSDSSYAGGSAGEPSGGGSVGDGKAGGESSSGGTGETGGPSTTSGGNPQGGQLTAGVWDDNRNYEFFKKYADSFAATRPSDHQLFNEQERTAARDKANGQQKANTELDVAVVFDTTGSMGDELKYLQTELDTITQGVKVKFPGVTPRWGLVVYKDRGDSYITQKYDFTADTDAFRATLAKQAAGGGGDLPEAVVDALETANTLSWRQDDIAKVAFWVADAPTHPGEGPKLATAVRNLRGKGVHVYPVGASGVDETAEYQMRSTAQITGGRYLFLTDDSGIGNAHKEPRIPCYQVTRLDQAVLRMLQIEVSGAYAVPAASEVIRSVGNPVDGKCSVSGGQVQAY